MCTYIYVYICLLKKGTQHIKLAITTPIQIPYSSLQASMGAPTYKACLQCKATLQVILAHIDLAAMLSRLGNEGDIQQIQQHFI